MDRMKYVLQSINVVNGLLMAVIAVVACFIVMPAHDPDIKSILPPVKGKAVLVPEMTLTQAKPPTLDYALISDQNIFHPERKIPPEKKVEKAVPKPEVVLYGTLITDQLSVAFVEDKKAPRTTQGRGKRQTALHKGEQLSGYTLKEITANSIVLTKGEEKIVVLLEDGDKRHTAESPLPANAGVVPGGAQPAAAAYAPQQSAGQKNVQAPGPYLQPVVPTGPPGGSDPGVRMSGRRNAAQLEVLRKKEAAYQQRQKQ